MRVISPFTNSCSGVYGGSVSEQDADDIRLIGSSRQVESSLSTYCGEVWISVVLYQVDHDVHVTHERCNMEWGQTRLKVREFYWIICYNSKHYLYIILMFYLILKDHTVSNPQSFYSAIQVLSQWIYDCYHFKI